MLRAPNHECGAPRQGVWRDSDCGKLSSSLVRPSVRATANAPDTAVDNGLNGLRELAFRKYSLPLLSSPLLSSPLRLRDCDLLARPSRRLL